MTVRGNRRMDTTPVYAKQYLVGLNEIDFARKLRPSALFNYFQDIASLAADALGVGMTRVGPEFGVAWILARMQVELLRQPDWGEQITIETWPQPPGRLEFERDYLVKDGSGGIVAKAVSSWVLMDIEQRRLRRPGLISLQLPPLTRSRAIDGQPERLSDPAELTAVYQRRIGYSDIDVNGHLNNARCVDFILDCFPLEVHRQSRVASLQLSFVNEALPGDTVTLLTDVAPASAARRYLTGINQRSDQVVFRALLELAQREE